MLICIPCAMSQLDLSTKQFISKPSEMTKCKGPVYGSNMDGNVQKSFYTLRYENKKAKKPHKNKKQQDDHKQNEVWVEKAVVLYWTSKVQQMSVCRKWFHSEDDYWLLFTNYRTFCFQPAKKKKITGQNVLFSKI